MVYKKEIVKGISFTGSLRFLTKGVGFLETIILARILVPEQFGAYGIALLALGLLETITQTGVNIVLIQEKETDRYISSAWFVSILRGVAIMIILAAVAPVIAHFFNAPQATILLYFISIVPLLRGFINPAVVKLQKELLFGKNFWYQSIILIIDTVTSITLTYITKNPIGIVYGLIAGVIIEVILSFIIITPRPTFRFDQEYIKKIFHRGKWVTATAIFDYLFFNIDNIAVGRLLGASALGIYQLAYSLAVTPLVELGNVFGYVMFPVLRKLSENREQLRESYLKALLSIIALSIPFVAIFTLAPHIFVLLLGEKWKMIATILPVLSILGFIKSISNVSSALFWSDIRQKYVTVITLVTTFGMVVLLVPLITAYGILGASYSALIGAVLSIPFVFFYTIKLLQVKKK